MEVKRRDLGKGRDNGNFKAGKFEMYFGVINEDLLIKHPWEWKKKIKKSRG